MPRIQSTIAREVLDSRGRPTVEVEIRTECGKKGRAIARLEPAPASMRPWNAAMATATGMAVWVWVGLFKRSIKYLDKSFQV